MQGWEKVPTVGPKSESIEWHPKAKHEAFRLILEASVNFSRDQTYGLPTRRLGN